MNEVILSNSAMPVVEDCGLLAASEPFYHMDRTADFDVLIYVKAGTIYVTENGTDYEINPGEAFFLKSGVHHYGKIEVQRGTTWYYFHFKNTAGQAEPEGQKFVLPKKLSGLEGGRIDRMIEQYIKFFWSEDVMKTLLVNHRFYALLSEFAEMGIENKKADSLSERICEYLISHYAEQFSAAKLEKHFFLSYKHMAAVFRHDMNTTMQQYHTKQRMSAAWRMLKSTLLPVSVIASRLGYKDPLYFSRCFHAVYGESPSACRRNGKYY